MTKKKTNPKVDDYLSEAKKWQGEMKKLRAILLDCQLTEELKWGKPCYTFQDGNIAIIIGFKDYCGLILAKGALLKDTKGILIKAGENTQAARQIRFTSIQEIIETKSILTDYIREAIEAEKAGLEVVYKKISEFTVPEELQNKLDELPALNTAFKALTPGRQRAYFLYISGAKQSKTRESRVEKCIPQILEGKGMDD